MSFSRSQSMASFRDAGLLRNIYDRKIIVPYTPCVSCGNTSFRMESVGCGKHHACDQCARKLRPSRFSMCEYCVSMASTTALVWKDGKYVEIRKTS